MRGIVSLGASAVMLAGVGILSHSVNAETPYRGSPFNGRWRIDYSCKQATGLYADRCAAGDRDHLEVNLAVQGQKLCGTGSATAQLENREGDAAIVGTFRGERAQVKWDILGAHGHGEFELRGKSMVFRTGVATPDDNSGWSFPPPPVILLTKVGPANPTQTACSADII